MASQLKQRIDALAAHRDARLLALLTRGIEKESLRVLPTATCRKRHTLLRWALR